ncbi:protein C-ets-1-like [Glandiceps talaboti]
MDRASSVQTAEDTGIPPEYNLRTCQARLNHPALPEAASTHQRNAFPKDPRDWSRDHVIEWLLWATQRYEIPEVDVEKFHMNGRGLAYLPKEGFVRRAPCGGEKLFEDFQRRFASAILEKKNVPRV